MIDVNSLMSRYRRASRETYNNHFHPFAESEADHEVFGIVDGSLFQVMVLDHLGRTAPSTGSPVAELVVRVRHPEADAWLQPQGHRQPVTEGDRFHFICLLDLGEPYAAKELAWLRVRVVKATDTTLLGADVLLRFEDVLFEHG